METLKITGLIKKYSNGRGVNNINLSINDGQIYGFLGPNGSGKTTTLKLIMGMISKDSGDIEICGYNTETHFEQAISNVGSMFEATVHYGDLTAFENMRQISRYYPEADRGRIDSLLALVGLSPYRNEKVHKFSLGMRQRLAIAGAMFSRPRLLILDEPFNGLDIEGIIEIRNAILELADVDKTAFFISSHMASEMEKMCTHISVIKDGNLLDSDDVDSIMENHPSFEDYFIAQVGKMALESNEGSADNDSI